MCSSAANHAFEHVIYSALTRVIRENPILSAIPVDEGSPTSYFASLSAINLSRCVTFLARVKPLEISEQDIELDRVLQEQHNLDFKTDYGALPFWRLIILKDAEIGLNFTACFIFYHGIGDGAAGLIFHRRFRDALDAVLSSKSIENAGINVQSSPDAQLLPPLEDLHPLPLNENPMDFRTKGLQEWTGALIQLPNKTRYRSLYLSPASSRTFAQRCKENNLTVTAGLQAVLAGALFDVLPSNIEALTGIIPINLRPWLALPEEASHDAIGSFIDAIKVQIPRSHYQDTKSPHGLSAARHTSGAIKNYLIGNLSPTGEPFTSVAFFKAIPDIAVAFGSMLGTARDAAFEISNLGRFEEVQRVNQGGNCSIGRMIFSRSTVAFGAALNTSVVSGADGGLTVGFSWQECVVETSVVESVVKGFKDYFESDAF